MWAIWLSDWASSAEIWPPPAAAPVVVVVEVVAVVGLCSSEEISWRRVSMEESGRSSVKKLDEISEEISISGDRDK